MFNIVLRTLAITDTISDFVEPYITQAVDFLGGQAPWIAALILLGVAIFTLVGIIVFIKKRTSAKMPQMCPKILFINIYCS